MDNCFKHWIGQKTEEESDLLFFGSTPNVINHLVKLVNFINNYNKLISFSILFWQNIVRKYFCFRTYKGDL